MMNTQQTAICGVHNCEMVLRPAGVSKTTGKAYPAFWSCPVKNADGSFCKFKPEEPKTNVERFNAGMEKDEGVNRQNETDVRIARSVALKASIDFYALGAPREMTKLETLVTADTFFRWLMKGEVTSPESISTTGPQIPVIQQEEIKP